MDGRVVQFRVGVMVLASLLITGILALLFGDLPSMVHGNYTVYIKFIEAPQVIVDTPVRKSGIRIGFVSDVQLNDDRTVTVTAEIEKKRQVYYDEVCRIDSSLMGDTSLNFIRSKILDAPATPVKPGETLTGTTATDPIKIITDLQGSFSQAIDSTAATSNKMNEVLLKVSEMIDRNQENIHDVILRADESLKAVQTVAENANDLVADPEERAQMRQAMADLPQLIRDTHATVNQASQAMAIVQENFVNMQGFTEKLGDPEMLGRLDRGTKNLDLLIAQLEQFSRSLNNPDGTLGRLVNDPQLYNNLNRAAENIDELSVQLGPIVHDVRVFTDKIARHPELVGVRGAFKPSSGLK